MKMTIFAVLICAALVSCNTAKKDPATDASKSTTQPTETSNADLDFVLVNKTGYDLKEVFVSPSKSKDWGSDIIAGGKGLKDGAEVKVTFPPKVKDAKWDMKVSWVGYSADEDVMWEDLDLTTIDKLTLKYDEKSKVTSVEINK